jgi:hypothetical protein
MVRIITLILTLLCLHSTLYAQSNGSRDREKPPSQSPSVGTGGPEGGPTGLFTIYDGSTLRRGEFTFSIAYSNYDRDPGNVDIVDVPLSFNVGVNDHIELFFKTNGWRGIKVNNPQNLSNFYLPNSQLFCGATLCSGVAIVLAPSRPNVGTIAGTAVLRPLNNQPFVQFPFVDGTAGTFGQGPGRGQFGFPGFYAQLGPPVAQPNSGNFGPADNFRGIGSPVGGILPGVVLATTTLPATALNLPITVPLVAPTYLPDAAFVNRLYGESNFNSMVFGAKIRFTEPHNPLGGGIIPFYHWWMDKADDFKDFNQMQRGAGPGGDVGDFGLIGFVDGRLGKHVNVSANGGYILNSNPKGLGGDFVLLDRPDEFLAGIGLDFPVNEHFQPIAEVRSTTYVGGHTPNAFNNNPVDVLGDIKIYPRRWFGFGLAYRRHLNQQDMDHFNPVDFTIPINPITNAVVADRGLGVVPGTSEDTDGFIAQFYIERRNSRTQNIYETRTWNRASYYTVNNPLAHLMLGMFVWDRDVSEQDRQRIRLALNRGPEHVKKICTLYGADSFECRYFKEAIDSFGPEGVDNGVTLSVGSIQTKGASAETNVAPCVKRKTKTKENPTGQRITIILTKEAVNADDLIHLVRHEGSHVADGSKWRASGCKRSSNPFVYETEFKAYTVASLSAQAYQPNVAYEFILPGGGRPGKNPFLPEILPIYRPDLKAEDLQILRNGNIDKLLARPKNGGGLYGVTPTSPGSRAFGLRQ